MTVQQGKLGSVDTTVDMEDFYTDGNPVDRLTDVSRIIHDGTQYIRLALTRPQPTLATRGTTSGTTQTESVQYIDGEFTANPSSDVNSMTIGFESSSGGVRVATTSIKLFSTTAITNGTTVGNWAVKTSLSNTEAEFSNSAFQATVTAVDDDIVATPAGNQVRYTLTVTAPSITSAGLPYWRITFSTAGAFNNITEVQIIEPLTPTMTFFGTNGEVGTSKTFDEDNILDACWDLPNNRFYTIRFNTDTVGSASVGLDDNFGEADAGTASGTGNFNSARWDEDTTNAQFVRTSNTLLYSVTTGKGQLETTYSLSDALDVHIDVIPNAALTANTSWFAIRALDSSNNTVMSEGIGKDLTTASGAFFSSYVTTPVDTTGGVCSIREMRPLWQNTHNGTDSFSVLFEGGASWSVSGTQSGLLSDATTGVLYDISTAATTPIEFIVSATATPGVGQGFTFNLVTASGKKATTSSGVIGLTRNVSDQWITKQVLLTPTAGSSEDVSIELFGNTTATINLTADNFEVTGTENFSDIATFTVEKFDQDGNEIIPDVISAFDVIGDPSKTYNDFLDGAVQIAATSSGSGTGHVYIKIENRLYKYVNNVALGTETGGSAVTTTTAQIPTNGIHSLQWTHESGVGGIPFLSYVEYDDPDDNPPGLDIVQLRTVSDSTLQDTSNSKELLLNITDYITNEYRLFYNQNDYDTLYYVDSSNNLRAWNTDDRISAFIAVNADDVTLPAGTAQQSNITAEVINAWGEALQGKTVTFAVTAGDGAINPSSDVTDSNGEATTIFIVGSTVGVSTVSATVTETA